MIHFLKDMHALPALHVFTIQYLTCLPLLCPSKHFLLDTPMPPSNPIQVLVVLIINNLKWRENQLAVDCAIGSLIAIK